MTVPLDIRVVRAGPRVTVTIRDGSREWAQACTRADDSIRALIRAAAEHHAGLDAEELERHVHRALAGGMRILSLADVAALPRLEWQLAGLLPVGVNFIAGPPNSGKSSIAFDLALRAYYGLPWLDGRAVRPCSVLYLASEGIAGLAAKEAAFRATHAVEEPHDRYLRIGTGTSPLSARGGFADIRAAVDELRGQYGHAPGLIVVDTLNGHWADSEDRADLVGPAMAELQQIALEYHACLDLIHHVRKPAQQPNGAAPAEGAWSDLRGSSAWAASADAILAVSGSPDRIMIRTLKQRDAERAAPVYVRLLSVSIGAAEDGTPRTATVVLPADPSAAPPDPFEQRVDEAVEALAALGGSAPSKRVLREKMGGKTETAGEAIDVAAQRGRIVHKPGGGGLTYTLPVNGPGTADHADSTEEGGSAVPAYRGGNREPLVPPVPGTTGNHPEPRFPGSGEMGQEPVDPYDAGMPAHPGGPRRKASSATRFGSPTPR